MLNSSIAALQPLRKCGFWLFLYDPARDLRQLARVRWYLGSALPAMPMLNFARAQKRRGEGCVSQMARSGFTPLRARMACSDRGTGQARIESVLKFRCHAAPPFFSSAGCIITAC